jgi:hypothetical protein
MAWSVLEPELCTVTIPVELLLIMNCWPSAKVLVTGSTTVWVVTPVKD